MSADPQTRRPRILPARALFAALLSLVLIAGCGGGEESEPSAQAFVAEADAICAEYAADTALLETRFNEALKTGNLENAAGDFRDQAARVSEMLDRLADLELPVSEQTLVDQLVAQGRQRVAAAEQAADAIAAGESEETIRLGREAMTLSDEYFRMADTLGLTECGPAGVSRTGTTTP